MRPAWPRAALTDALTNHARVLLRIAHDSGARLRDIAASLGITDRSAFAIVTDLTAAGYVVKHKDGRRNLYQIQAHLPLPEPARNRDRRSPGPAHRQPRQAATQRRPTRLTPLQQVARSPVSSAQVRSLAGGARPAGRQPWRAEDPDRTIHVRKTVTMIAEDDPYRLVTCGSVWWLQAADCADPGYEAGAVRKDRVCEVVIRKAGAVAPAGEDHR